MTDFPFETTDFLLKRNWFLTADDIRELLWLLDEDVFQLVLSKADTYPFNVKNILINECIPYPPSNKLKLIVIP
jgi:hypothetical protein